MRRSLVIITLLGLAVWPLWGQLAINNGASGLTLSVSGTFQTAYQNVPYTGCVQMNGGAPPFTVVVLSGSPPTGISPTFTVNGTSACISGTPTGTGASSITIRATDSKNATQTTPIVAITVNTLTGLAVIPTGQTISVSTTLQMTTKNVGTTWSNSCSLASCPNIDTLVTWAPTTFGTAGTLGLHTGLLTAGSTAATPSVTAAFNSTTSAGDTVTITNTSPNPVLSTASLPNGQINLPYPESGSVVGSNQLACSGGSGGPFTFQNSSGAMPTGFPALPSSGLITGTSTAAATYTPHFTCTDNASHVSAAVTLNIVIASLSTISTPTPATPTAAQFGTQQFSVNCNYSDSSVAPCPGATGGGQIIASACGSNANNTTNVATLATSSPCSVAVGDTLQITYYSDNAATPTYTIPTDTAGNTASATTGQQCVGGASDRCERTYYMPITIANASDTITGHYGTATHPVVIMVTKLMGATATPLDQNGNSSDGGTASNQPTYASITPTVVNTMAVFSPATNGSGRTFTAGTGCAQTAIDPAGFVGMEACGITSTSATTENMLINGTTDNWIAAISNYKPQATGGVVWTATTASGVNPVSISNTGLASALNPGTSNIKASIGATNSPNNLMTVTAASDTSIAVVCPSGINVGSQAQCTATGQPSGTNDTNTATWSSNNPAIVQSLGVGGIQGIANGTTTIHVTLGALGANSGNITVSTASSTGLLSGCTVNASNIPSCSTPGGWSLLIADGAEAGTTGIETLFGSAQCTAGNITSLGTTIPAHTLSHSYCGEYAGDGQEVSVRINIPNGTHSTYLSWWERLDPQGMYPSSDYILSQVYTPNAIIGTQAQTFNGNGSFLSTTHYPHSYQTNNNEFFWYSGPTPTLNPTIDAGVWVQYEELITPDTIDGTRLAAQQVPPASCVNPTDPFCGNGVLKLWQNGTLVLNLNNAQFTFNSNFFNSNAVMHVGDFLTSFANTSTDPSGRCLVWSSTGGGTCPGTQPGTGGPKPFFRYYDDIIVLTQ